MDPAKYQEVMRVVQQQMSQTGFDINAVTRPNTQSHPLPTSDSNASTPRLDEPAIGISPVLPTFIEQQQQPQPQPPPPTSVFDTAQKTWQSHPPLWTSHRNYLSEALDYVPSSRDSECIQDGVVISAIVEARHGTEVDDEGDACPIAKQIGGIEGRGRLVRKMTREYLGRDVCVFAVGGKVEEGKGGAFAVRRGEVDKKRVKMGRRRRKEVVKAWKRTRERGVPFVLIVERGFDGLGLGIGGGGVLDVRQKWVVLGHFVVSEIWAERVDGPAEEEVVWMVKVQKAEVGLESWWWTGMEMGLGKEVEWDAEFFEPTAKVGDGMRPSYALVPDLRGMLERIGSSVNRSRLWYRAMVCPGCKSIVPKVYWKAWFCHEQLCKARLKYVFEPGRIPLETVVPRVFVSYAGHPSLSPQWSQEGFGDRVRIHRNNYTMDKWEDLHAGYQLIVLSPTANFNTQPNGPDWLYESVLQEVDAGKIELQRWKNESTNELDSHYHWNIGVQYGFSQVHAAEGLREASPAILSAKVLLDHSAEHELQGKWLGHNNIQMLTYLDGMKMPWHVDGDHELGPTTTTLNLGGDAIFRLRLRKEHYENDDTWAEDSEVAKGSRSHRQRRPRLVMEVVKQSDQKISSKPATRQETHADLRSLFL